VISGAGGLATSGSGTVILSGNSTYTGPTSVLGGVTELTGSILDTSSLTISSGGVFYLASGLLDVSGNITNNGIFKITGTPTVTQTGSFINNGFLDLINGPQTLPPRFVNNGTVLTPGSVIVQQMVRNGSSFALTIQGYAQHTYQLQRSPSLTTPVWTNVGAAQTGQGSPLVFTDTAASGAQGFYQFIVSP